MKKYHLNHRYRDFLIVPYIGITNNIDFLQDDERIVITNDKVEAEVVSCKIKNFFSVLDLIEKHYKMQPFDWLQTWYNVNKTLQSLDVLLITLKKC